MTIVLTGAITRATPGSRAKSCPVGGADALAASITGTKHISTFIALVHDCPKALTEYVKQEAPPVLIAGSIGRTNEIRIEAVGNAITVRIRSKVVEPIAVFVNKLANPMAVA